MKAAHLDAERTGKKGMDENQAVMSIIREDRRCKKWTPYIPGFSPKERFEQYQTEHMERDRRRFERRMNTNSLIVNSILTFLALAVAALSVSKQSAIIEWLQAHRWFGL